MLLYRRLHSGFRPIKKKILSTCACMFCKVVKKRPPGEARYSVFIINYA